MAKINLLPWREKERNQRRVEFLTIMGIAAAITAGLFFIFYMYVNAKIEYQESRNVYLQDQIVFLDTKIKDIQLLEKKRENLLARMEAIQKLQASRPVTVRLFDELVTTLPAGVYVTSLNQTGSTVVIKGTAQSNSLVSNFMRNIEKSDWIANPSLTVIQSATRENQRLSDFELRLTQSAPKKAGEDILAQCFSELQEMLPEGNGRVHLDSQALSPHCREIESALKQTLDDFSANQTW